MLVARLEMAIETIQEFIFHSELARRAPIFAYYFPGSLSESALARLGDAGQNVVVIPTSIPSPRFEKSEMFYARKNQYAKRFGKGRIGYLDMCHWTTNFFAEPRLSKFDFILRFDDDSWLKASPDISITAALRSSDWTVASAGLNSTLSQNSWDTRENFFSFTRRFVETHHVRVADQRMKFALDTNDEASFHSLPRSLGNFNLYRASDFRGDTWLSWAYAVNLYGGHHRFRWSDIIVTGAFARFVRTDALLDLGLVASGIYWKSKPGTMPLRHGVYRILTLARLVLRTLGFRGRS